VSLPQEEEMAGMVASNTHQAQSGDRQKGPWEKVSQEMNTPDSPWTADQEEEKQTFCEGKRSPIGGNKRCCGGPRSEARFGEGKSRKTSEEKKRVSVKAVAQTERKGEEGVRARSNPTPKILNIVK